MLVSLLPDTLDFHVAIASAYRGLWARDETLWLDLIKIALFLGARLIVTRAPDERTRRLVNILLPRRFGFKIAEDGTAYKRIED